MPENEAKGKAESGRRSVLVQIAKDQAQEAFLHGTVGGQAVTATMLASKLSLLAQALESADNRIAELEGS